MIADFSPDMNAATSAAPPTKPRRRLRRLDGASIEAIDVGMRALIKLANELLVDRVVRVEHNGHVIIGTVAHIALGLDGSLGLMFAGDPLNGPWPVTGMRFED